MSVISDERLVPRSTSVDLTRQANRLGMANMWVAFGSFALAIPMGLYQVAERSNLFPVAESADLYYTSVSTHGVLMAYVLTTFFIMGYGYHAAIHSLNQSVWSPAFSWTGFGLALLGTVMAAYALLTGQASVMYTFYPPEFAILPFYVGVALLVVGSYFWCADMVIAMMQWRRANPGRAVPLVMFGFAMTSLLWAWTSMGAVLEVLFQIIPLLLGWVDTIESGLARTLFSWTLHGIVYFWLFPAYIAMYTLMPQIGRAHV